MDYYYTDSQNQSKGPVSEDEIKALVASGALTGASMICQVGSQQWVPVSTLVATVAPPLPARKNEPLAIWSFVLSLIFCCQPIAGIAAVVCGHIALARYKKAPELQGKGFALAGVIIGYVMLGGWILYLVFFGGLAVIQALMDHSQ